MKFAKSTLLLLLSLSSSNAFVANKQSSLTFHSNINNNDSTTTLRMSTTVEESGAEAKKKTKKLRRMEIMKADNFFRRGFKEVRDEVEKSVQDQYGSSVVDEMKENNNVIEQDGVKVYLAKDFGFCWGVERSIALSYEAVKHFPDKKIHMTNELIHNPEVNDRLGDMNVQFIEKLEGGKKRFEAIGDGDVVILPAFGASLEEMDLLTKRNVEIVDTTCPWVSKVWNTVDTHQKKGLTSVIHGKYAHEETVATVSFCEDYICIKDMKEAEMVTDYIINGGDKEEFLSYFKNAISEGFDPDTMLDKVGIANQTTMYKKETRAIGQLFQKAMMTKYGPVESKEKYFEFDTICDATQERQDAISDLVDNSKELDLDFILVVGGWDSSNTAHLVEIPHHKGIRTFHINRSECISPDNTITHRTVDGEIVTEPFILDMEKDVVMGVTSGASTPDSAVQDSLGVIFLLKNLSGAKN